MPTGWSCSITPSPKALRDIDADFEFRTPTPGAFLGYDRLNEHSFTSGAFSDVVSLLGNSSFQTQIINYHLRYGGSIVLHDETMIGILGVILYPSEFAKELKDDQKAINPAKTDCSVLRQDSVTFLRPLLIPANKVIVHNFKLAALIEQRFGKKVDLMLYPFYKDSVNLINYSSSTAPRKLITTMGTVARDRNIEAIIEALLALKDSSIDLHCVEPVDDAEYADHLLAMTEKTVLQGNVLFTGQVVQDVYDDYFRRSHLNIQLRKSSPLTGALSGCVTESLASGTNIIISSVLVDSMGLHQADCPYLREYQGEGGPLLAQLIAELLPRSSSENIEPAKVLLETRSMEQYVRKFMELFST